MQTGKKELTGSFWSTASLKGNTPHLSTCHPLRSCHHHDDSMDNTGIRVLIPTSRLGNRREKPFHKLPATVGPFGNSYEKGSGPTAFQVNSTQSDTTRN